MKATKKLFSFDEAYNLDSKDVNRLYKEYSNIKLPDIYNKFSFGKKFLHNQRFFYL